MKVNIFLYHFQAKQLKDMIDKFCSESEKVSLLKMYYHHMDMKYEKNELNLLKCIGKTTFTWIISILPF